MERTASSSSLKSGEAFDGSLRRAEVEVRVRLELGEWLTGIGWVYYTLGMNSKFVVAKKRRSVQRFAEKGGGRGVRAAATLSVANRNRLGLVRSGRGFHRESTRTFQDRTVTYADRQFKSLNSYGLL